MSTSLMRFSKRESTKRASLSPAPEIRELEAAVGRVVRGKDRVVRLALISVLAEGHLLVEDVPGVGKTTLARALARAIGLEFQRIQFTSDLLPSDIIGVSIYRERSQEFEFVPGPLFAGVVLADEINRATPKTQSALLEAMSESVVSVERTRYELPRPFVVLATQNPLEYHGTFPLPESQLDRFFMSLRMGYPDRAAEREILSGGAGDEIVDELRPVLDARGLLELQQRVREVVVADKLVDYMLALVETTRQDDRFVLPVSTRGARALYRGAQASAFCEGREFALPEDVQSIAVAVLAHRVVVGGSSVEDDLQVAEQSRRVIEEILEGLPVPV